MAVFHDGRGYMHNWPLQFFSYDYGVASHTNYVVCLNFICEWRDVQFTVDSERQIFEKLFHVANLFDIQRFCQKSGERKLQKKWFASYFVLMSDLGYEHRHATY